MSSRLSELERRGDGDGRHEIENDTQLLEAILASKREGEPPTELVPGWPIARRCSRRYRAVRDSGSRRLSAIELGVVHTTQGSTAAGAAGWFTDSRARGSAHVVVDALECYRTLPPSAIPWGAPGVNGRGWHLEIAGFAQWTRADWLDRPRLLRRAAYKLALAAETFDFPLVVLTARQLRAGNRRGVIGHRTASVAFGGSHWDPGPGFPWEAFIAQARAYRGRL